MKRLSCLTIVSVMALNAFAAGDSNWFKAQSKEAKIVSASATSELVEAQFEGRYLYSPANMLDGDMSTTWCEAEKDGSGIGQVITLEFEQPFSFDEIQVVNGFNYKNLYLQNNRVKKIQLTQVAGKHFQQKDYVLADKTPGWQSIKFEQLQTTQTVTIKILEVYKGTNFDDTCFSDIKFLCKGKEIPFSGVAELKAIQNENSIMLLSEDAKNFKEDFFALFKKRGESNYGDLILMPAKGGTPYYLVKRGKSLCTMYKREIYKKDNLEKLRRDCSIATIYDREKGEEINVIDHPEVLGNAKYIVVIPHYYDYSFRLENYKIIRTETVGYVETETTTIVKLDGKNVYLNGVHYTVLPPEDFIMVSVPE